MDNLILDLIAKRNWTQARKAIEKKLKQKKYEENNALIVSCLCNFRIVIPIV